MAYHPKTPSSPQYMSQANPAAPKFSRSSSRMSSVSRVSSDEDQSKTAVRVAIRVRPPLEPGQPGYELIPQRFQRSILTVTNDTSLIVESPQGRRNYIFDRVFNENVGQEGVMNWLKDAIDSFITGYNVSLLAYGQSGAGKSYTMGTSGPNEQNDPWQMGVIPRAARTLFAKLAADNPEKATHTARAASGSGIRPPSRLSMQLSPAPAAAKPRMHKIVPNNKDWTLKATYVEIYNDELRDLLLPPELRDQERLPITIREDTKGTILLTGLREVVVNDVEDLLAALNYGSSIRQTDATAINARSSRSHAVFSLSLVQRKRKSVGTPNSKDNNRRWTISGMDSLNGEQGDEATVTISSKLHFVDLAGSERLKNTGAQGDRAKEGISINAGLAALGKVISQLSARSGTTGHISYRDSKLTRILSDSLGGNAITYMIACITPAEFHRSETLNTVQYAQRARAIQSRPQISEVLDEAELRAVVDRLKAEVASLREQLRNANKHTDDRHENRTAVEQELQDQLFDLQESYSGLSARHARLMAELSRERGIETSEITIAADDDPNSPMNRIKRSNSFAEAVEMVILEYEKTIQSLENTLAEVRASLAQTESTLLEKESKLAYAESINQQLNARVSKLTQREANTAEYVRKLETRLDEKEAEASGASQVETETIQELRIENARLRDHEQSSEAYLAVLEENLAEADADIEFWKREVDRLERVVERQRGLRKLDTLLDELDEVQQEALEHARSELLDAENAAVHADQAKEAREVEDTTKATANEDAHPQAATTDLTVTTSDVSGHATPSDDKENQAPKEAQPSLDDNFLRAELANLRKSHETTVRKLEDLTNTYNSSLECIAELKDQLDKSQEAAALQVSINPPVDSADTPPAESKDPPNLEIAGVRTLKTAAIAEKLLAAGPQRSFSRSRSSEHLSAGVSESYKNGMTNGETHDETEEDVEAMKDEIEDLRQKVQGLEELRREHAKLTENYNESMDLLDELKGQLQRPPPSPVQPVSPMRPGLIRSRSISDIKNVQNDRATRALDSLSAKFDDLVVDDELKKSLHASLSIVTTEIISKSSQCQQQASEIVTLRADVDAKTRLISGLTKAQSRTADPAYISALENQMAEMESEHKQVVDKLKERQTQLIAKVEDLTKELDVSAQELEKHKTLQQDYRKLLNDILIDKRRNSVMSQSSVDSYPASASVIMTGTSRTELTSDYGDHDTLDKELAQADSEDEEEPDHTALIAELKSRLSVIDTVEHTRVVKGLKQELEEVRSAYEEDTSELQKTLIEVKSQLLLFSRQRSVSESSGSDTTKDGSESHQSTLEKVKNLQSQLSKRDQDHQELIQLLDAAQVMSTERERKANELTASLQELQKMFNYQSSTVESLTAEMTQLKSQHAESLQQLASTQIKAEEVQKRLSETEARVKSITAERDSALRDMVDVRDKVQTLARQHDALVREMESSHKEEVQGLKKDNSEYLTIIQHLKDQVSESEASISTYLLQITSFQQKLEAASKDSDKAKRAKAAVDRDLKEIRNEVSVISRQKQETKDKLAEVTEMLNQLQSDYENLKARKNSIAPETEAVVKEQTELIQALEARLAEFETRPGSSADPSKRLRSGSLTGGRWSNGTPTPPPTMRRPPRPGGLPNPPPSPLQANFGRTTSTGRSLSRTNSQDQLPRSASRDQLRSPAESDALRRELEEKDLKIANLEKQFQSERQLVQTLEEALSDTEKSMKQLKKQTNSLAAEKEMLHTKMLDVSHQLEIAKKEAAKSRDSIQQLDEARAQRAKAEAARRQLEDRMEEIAHRRRSKFSCF